VAPWCRRRGTTRNHEIFLRGKPLILAEIILAQEKGDPCTEERLFLSTI
jgi:hypothetical protein